MKVSDECQYSDMIFINGRHLVEEFFEDLFQKFLDAKVKERKENEK